MTKQEIVNHMSKKTGLTKKDAEASLDSFLEGVKTALKKGDSVGLVGFGTFNVSKRSARMGRNPQTGATIKIPARKVPVFRAGKGLKDVVR